MESKKIKEIDEEGNVYKGDVVDGVRHGKGILLFAGTGNVYQGDFENGLQHGTGKFVKGGQIEGNKDGIYEGLWKEGKLTQVKKGKARIELENGDVYEGGFNHWKRHGKGKLFEYNGAFYEGQWKDGLRHGPGKQTFPDGYVFKGKFKEGKIGLILQESCKVLYKIKCCSQYFFFFKHLYNSIGEPVRDGTHQEERVEVASVALNPYQDEPIDNIGIAPSTRKPKHNAQTQRPQTGKIKKRAEVRNNNFGRAYIHRSHSAHIPRKYSQNSIFY